MDPVTHTLVGAALGNALFRDRVGPRAGLIMAVASNLPDVDAIVHLTGSSQAILMRRTFGHSLLLIPFWAAGLAWLLKRRWFKNIRLEALFGMCLLGALVHLFFDLINSFGVVPLWPASLWRPELAIVFIIDLILAGILAAPLLLALAGFGKELGKLSTAALALTSAYLMLCGTGRSLTLLKLSQEAGRLGVRPGFTYAFPEPFGPHRWRGVIRAGDIYRVYLVRPFAGSLEAYGEIETRADDPRVLLVRDTPLGRKLDWFFKAPVWSIKGSAGSSFEVSAHDLRFKPLLVNLGSEGNPVFRYRFRVDRDGSIVPL